MRKLKYCNSETYVLIVIDMLNDFVSKGAVLEVPMARAIVDNIKKQMSQARRHRIPIVYCCDAHRNNDLEFKLWPRHAVKGTDGAKVIKQLKPHREDYVVAKTSYSCFYKTSLGKLLKKLGRTHLIITGVVTNICVLYTAVDAYMRGYKVTIPKNCVAAITKSEHQFALRQIERLLHAEMV